MLRQLNVSTSAPNSACRHTASVQRNLTRSSKQPLASAASTGALCALQPLAFLGRAALATAALPTPLVALMSELPEDALGLMPILAWTRSTCGGTGGASKISPTDVQIHSFGCADSSPAVPRTRLCRSLISRPCLLHRFHAFELGLPRPYGHKASLDVG